MSHPAPDPEDHAVLLHLLHPAPNDTPAAHGAADCLRADWNAPAGGGFDCAALWQRNAAQVTDLRGVTAALARQPGPAAAGLGRGDGGAAAAVAPAPVGALSREPAAPGATTAELVLPIGGSPGPRARTLPVLRGSAMSPLLLRPLLATLALTGCFTASWAQNAPHPAVQAFTRQFQSLCMQSLGQLDALRQRLRQDPGVRALDAEQARPFLHGQSGDAWWLSDPDSPDGFTLALLHDGMHCLLHQRQAPTGAIEQAFQALVRQAPAPLQARPMGDETRPDTPSGRHRFMRYVWMLPNGVPHQGYFLTTVDHLNGGAPAQVFASSVQFPALSTPRPAAAGRGP